MKKIFFMTALLLVTAQASADYGSIKCQGRQQRIELRLNEVSDTNKDTAILLINDTFTVIDKLMVQENKNGLLAIQVQQGLGPRKYSYHFENLGSKKCFANYSIDQKGPAKVKVYNSMGLIQNLICECDVD